MKKILLVCCAGMSTSLLVNRMREVAKTKEIDCKIWSTSEKELPNEFAQEPADVILVGPQIRYLLNNICLLYTSLIKFVSQFLYYP